MITIEHVPVAEVVASTALIAEYAAECSIPAIGEINPQGHAYTAMEDSGLLRSFMVYRDEKEIGFAILLTPVLPHYGQRVATTESLFISRPERNSEAGLNLLRHLEQYAREVGCVGILYSAPAGGMFEKVLSGMSSVQRTNSVFFRRVA